MTTATLIATLAVFAGAAVQSGLGFGIAIVAAPALAATAGPAQAAPTLAVAAMALNVLVVVGERRPSAVMVPTAVRLIAWGVPGMLIGAAVLALVDPLVLSVIVALAVLLAVGLRLRAERLDAPVVRRPDGPIGVVSGALGITTGIGGAPLVLHLLGRATPAQTRDTLAVVFLASNLIGVVVYLATGTLKLADGVGVMAVAAVVGWAVGRVAFMRLGPEQHRVLSLIVLAVGAVVAVVQVALTASG